MIAAKGFFFFLMPVPVTIYCYLLHYLLSVRRLLYTSIIRTLPMNNLWTPYAITYPLNLYHKTSDRCKANAIHIYER